MFIHIYIYIYIYSHMYIYMCTIYCIIMYYTYNMTICICIYNIYIYTCIICVLNNSVCVCQTTDIEHREFGCFLQRNTVRWCTLRLDQNPDAPWCWNIYQKNWVILWVDVGNYSSTMVRIWKTSPARRTMLDIYK